MTTQTCALCGRVGSLNYHPVAVYAGTPGNRPDGEWLCWGENESNSRKAWACYYRYQCRALRDKKQKGKE